MSCPRWRVSCVTLTILLLCYYHLGMILGFVSHGIISGGGGDVTKVSDGQLGPGLPSALFKDQFPKKTLEVMQGWSEQVQWQLKTLNTLEALRSNSDSPARGCQGPKVRCGAPFKCELGCQIHAMMTCLMISYTTNRTLVPTWRNWLYTDPGQKWGHLFQPIGFNCPFDRDTGVVTWHKNTIEITTRDLLETPFHSGFTIPEDIGVSAKHLGVDVFHWWAGQFAKFAFRLHPLQERGMTKVMGPLKFRSPDNPIVGILVRRRDKVGERRKTSNSLDKYMTIAKKFFWKIEAKRKQSTLEGKGNSSSPSVPPPRRIYLATDDKSLLLLARKQYPPPKWEILGFQRSPEVEDLLKDIVFLSHCDFVLCSFSSDICRLVSELKESREVGGGKRVKSLDYKYFYDIPDLSNGKNKFHLL